jgi:predicted nucleic acid-binding protein
VNAVFLDTVGMIALWDEADQWHQEAELARAKFRIARTPVVTTTCVLLECGNAAARRSYRRVVTQFRDVMIANGGLSLVTMIGPRRGWPTIEVTPARRAS